MNAPAENAINVLVTSRHDEDCKRICSILSNENDFHITGIVKDIAGIIIKSERFKPDVIILDMQPPGMSGEELAPIIHRKSPSTAIVILSENEEENDACSAVKAGVSGFLLKEKDAKILSYVVKLVNSGGLYVSSSIFIRVFNAIDFKNQFPGQVINELNTTFSPIERSIITDLANGLSDREIAKHLNYCTGTIRNYLSGIKRNIKLKNRIQIALFSLVYGLIRLEQLDIWKNHRQFAKNEIQ
ncbi:MAG: response regulator transcription factor [Treponema sp.]|nr:response regulator transcription factor [Treponema sp.]